MSYRILRLPQVMQESGLARSTIYQRISQGLLTKPIALGLRCAGWPEAEIKSINAARIAGKTDAEIRNLVAALEASRKEVA
jgi:prophage regulatory protein